MHSNQHVLVTNGTTGSQNPALLAWSRGSTHNNYDVLRVLLAASVIVSHASVVAFGSAARQPLTWLLHGITLGEIAVGGFFAISGYLVTASWRSSTPVQYFQKRAARILPGFLLACALTSALACATSINPMASIRHTDWMHVVETTITLRRPVVYLSYSANPYREETNASMWTIKYEAACYAATALLGLTGLLCAERRRFVLVLFLSVTIAGAMLGSSNIDQSYLSYAVRLLTFYMAGVTVYCFRDLLRRSWWVAGVCVLTLTASSLAGRLWVTLTLPTAGVYLLFLFVYAERCVVPGLKQKVEDLSYGMYLYGWPVAQSIETVLRGRGVGVTQLAVLSIVASLPIAYVSWHLIEEPMLSLVSRSSPQERPGVRLLSDHPA